VPEIKGHFLVRAGEASASRVRDHLRTLFMRSLTKPMLGIEAGEQHILHLAPIRNPYRIYYTVMAVDPAILHVRHSSRIDPDLVPRITGDRRPRPR
jgi:hypothetical protein